MSTEFYPIEEIEADLELQNKAAKEIIDKILSEREKKENKCARKACQKPLVRHFYRICNDPITELGYRDYCVKCGRKIVEYDEFCEGELQYSIFYVGVRK